MESLELTFKCSTCGDRSWHRDVPILEGDPVNVVVRCPNGCAVQLYTLHRDTHPDFRIWIEEAT